VATSAPETWHQNYRPALAVNGAGLDATGLLHKNDFSINTWQVFSGSPVTHHEGGVAGSTWFHVDLGAVYDLAEMWVWNLGLTGYSGIGLRNVTIEYSVDGAAWTTLTGWTNKLTGLAELARSNETNNYPHETEIDLDVQARYILITAAVTDGSWDNSNTRRGLAEVKFFAVEFQSDFNADKQVELQDFSVISNSWSPEPLLWPAP